MTAIRSEACSDCGGPASEHHTLSVRVEVLVTAISKAELQRIRTRLATQARDAIDADEATCHVQRASSVLRRDRDTP